MLDATVMHQAIQQMVREIEKRMNSPSKLRYPEEFLTSLKNLTPLEKYFIKKKVLNMSWNIGAANTILLLESADILDAGEYLLNCDKDIEYILMDVLESSFPLLASLMRHLGNNSFSSMKITNILEQSFASLIADVIAQPEIININYMYAVKDLVSENCYNLIKTLHFDILLGRSCCNIEEAIRQQREWNEELQRNQLLVKLMSEICSDHMHCIDKLFQLAGTPDFGGWKFYILFLRIIEKSERVQLVSRQFLKNQLQLTKEKNCMASFFIMMLTARQFCLFDSCQQFGTYGQWYKKTFGDLQYQTNTIEFKNILNALQELLKYENDSKIIDIHGHTTISAPQFCNALVLEYKQMCRTKLANNKCKQID